LSDLSDEELIQMYREGDAVAFDVLFDRYRAPVYNFARTMLNGSDRAEDVMQETFLAVARAAKRYEARGFFRTWLMRIVRNLCLNCIGFERARRAVVAQSGLNIVEPTSPEPCPPDRAEQDEQMALVRAAIAELPERQREAIVLYAFEQMPYREIAHVLDVPLNTVKTLIHRARATLAHAIEQHPEERSNGV